MTKIIDLHEVRVLHLAGDGLIFSRYFSRTNLTKGTGWAPMWVTYPCDSDGEPMVDGSMVTGVKTTRENLLALTRPLSTADRVLLDVYSEEYANGCDCLVCFNTWLSEPDDDGSIDWVALVAEARAADAKAVALTNEGTS